MPPNKRKKHISVLSTLHRLEQGHRLPQRLSWRAEITALSHLRTSTTNINPTAFTGIPREPSKRHNHIVQLAASADHALLAVTASDGRVEIHEPRSDGETRRLSLMPSQNRLKASSCAWFSHNDSDVILLSFQNLPHVWLYDLATCRVNMPCRKFDLSSYSTSSRHRREQASDLFAVDNNCWAVAVSTGEILLYDARLKSTKHARLATIRSGMCDAVMTGEDMVLYAADGGSMAVYDRRYVSENTGSGKGMQVAGMKGSGSRAELLRKDVSGSRGFNFIKVLPGSAQGCVGYQTMDGAVGYVDMGSAAAPGVHVPEVGERVVGNGSGLMEYGVTERTLNYPWHILRRRGDIVRGPGGDGWRVVAPMISKFGIRALSLGPGVETRAFEIPVGQHISCVHALDKSLETLILAGAKNHVGMMNVRLRNRSKDTTDCNL